jgi:hypothetical protein
VATLIEQALSEAEQDAMPERAEGWLAPARGIAIGVGLGLVLWVAIGWVVWLIAG